MRRHAVATARTVGAAAAVLAVTGASAAAEPPREPRCTNVKSRPIPTGYRGREHWVVGRDPVLLGGFHQRAASPLSLTSGADGTMEAGQFYFMLRRGGPAVITVTGWRFRDRGTALLLDDFTTRGPTLILRRKRMGPEGGRHAYAVQPAGLVAPSPGCYVVRAVWPGGEMRVRIDLRREMVVIPPPAA